MSQVIVEHDSYESRRAKARAQEHKISRDLAYQKWQSTGTFGLKTLARLAGLAFLPVLAFWLVIYAGMALMIAVLTQIFRVLGAIVPRSK